MGLISLNFNYKSVANLVKGFLCKVDGEDEASPEFCNRKVFIVHKMNRPLEVLKIR